MLALVSMVLGHALPMCVDRRHAHVVVLAKSLVLSFLDCLIGDVPATGTATALAALFIPAFKSLCPCP